MSEAGGSFSLMSEFGWFVGSCCRRVVVGWFRVLSVDGFAALRTVNLVEIGSRNAAYLRRGGRGDRGGLPRRSCDLVFCRAAAVFGSTAAVWTGFFGWGCFHRGFAAVRFLVLSRSVKGGCCGDESAGGCG